MMLFYLQMKWNIARLLSFDEVWKLEVEEALAAQGHFKVLSMYKVAGQQRVISIVEMNSAGELDRAIMGRLPLRKYLGFEAIWPLRTFESFVEDCRTGLGDVAPATELKAIVTR